MLVSDSDGFFFWFSMPFSGANGVFCAIRKYVVTTTGVVASRVQSSTVVTVHKTEGSRSESR
jgi:hypothetical protein